VSLEDQESGRRSEAQPGARDQSMPIRTNPKKYLTIHLNIF